MSILDFLLDNWFLTLIALWFLFGLFGRGNREKASREQHRHPAAKRTPHERQRGQQTLRTQTERGEVKRTLSDTMRKTAQDLRSRIEELEEEWHEQQKQDLLPETVQTTVSTERADAREVAHSYHQEREVAKSSERRIKEPTRSIPNTDAVMLNKGALKQGVVWAEVLGKPRAKRPYRPPYMRHD